MFAAVLEMEPGQWFRLHRGGPVVQWRGVDPVASRFTGKRRVRVLVSPGDAFVCDASSRFELVDWRGRR